MGDEQSRPAFTAAGDGAGVAVTRGSGFGAASGLQALDARQETVAGAVGSGGARGDAGASGGLALASQGDADVSAGGGAAAAGGALPQEEQVLPTESEILARLVTALGQCPSRTLSLDEIRERLPPHLRRLTEDVEKIRKWLKNFPGLLEVTGGPGEECVALIVGKAFSTDVAPAVASPLPPPAAVAVATLATPAAPPPQAVSYAAPSALPMASGFAMIGDGDDDGMNPSTVQLRGLPFRATVGEIRAFLGPHQANLANSTEPPIRLLLNRDGRPSGFARVQFTSPEAARVCREALHKQKMGDRYVEVLACTERSGKARSRRAEVGAIELSAGGGICLAPAGKPIDSATEAAERERVLQECREHMRLPGRNQILLSMLGIALSPPARAYLRRANLGLKHFLARFQNEFHVEGPKGCERVLWAGATQGCADFGGYSRMAAAAQAAMVGQANTDAIHNAALAAGVTPEQAASIAMSLAGNAARVHNPWQFAGIAGVPGGYGTWDVEADHAAAAAALEAAATHALAAQAQAAQMPRLAPEPLTPRSAMSPAPHKTGGNYCAATPSDWGTPGLGGSHSHEPKGSSNANGANASAAAAAAAAAAVSAQTGMANGHDMSGFPGGGGAWPLPPYMFPPPWAAYGGNCGAAWGAIDVGAAAGPPPGQGLEARQPAKQQQRPLPAATIGHFATGAGAGAGGLASANGSKEGSALASRSHAHLHPQSHPFAHRQGADAPAATAPPPAQGGLPPPEAPDSSLGPCLRLRGLPFSATVQDVFTFFSQHEVADRISTEQGAAQLLPKANGRPSGQAVVQMRSIADAQLAKAALSNQYLGGRYIEVFCYGGEEGEEEATNAPASGDRAVQPAPGPGPPAHIGGGVPMPGQAPLGPGGMPWNMSAAAWGGLMPPPVPGGLGGMSNLGALGQGEQAINDDTWSALFSFMYRAPGQPDGSLGSLLPPSVAAPSVAAGADAPRTLQV